MKRHFRICRLLKWFGTAVCVLIVLIALVGLRGQAIDLNFGYRFGVRFIAGIVNVVVRNTSNGGVPTQFSIWVSPRTTTTWQETAAAWSKLGLTPRLHTFRDSNMSVYSLGIPLWMLLALFGVPTAFLWRLDRRRNAAGCCGKCGYDLTGNVSGRCPECGTPAKNLRKSAETVVEKLADCARLHETPPEKAGG